MGENTSTYVSDKLIETGGVLVVWVSLVAVFFLSFVVAAANIAHLSGQIIDSQFMIQIRQPGQIDS